MTNLVQLYKCDFSHIQRSPFTAVLVIILCSNLCVEYEYVMAD